MKCGIVVAVPTDHKWKHPLRSTVPKSLTIFQDLHGVHRSRLHYATHLIGMNNRSYENKAFSADQWPSLGPLSEH